CRYCTISPLSSRFTFHVSRNNLPLPRQFIVIQTPGWDAAFVDPAAVAALYVGVGVLHLDNAALLQVEEHQPGLHRVQARLAGGLVHDTEGRHLVMAAQFV